MVGKITCTWSTNRGEETRVSFNGEYDRMNRLSKLDFLQDAIYELNCEYDKIYGEKHYATT